MYNSDALRINHAAFEFLLLHLQIYLHEDCGEVTIRFTPRHSTFPQQYLVPYSASESHLPLAIHIFSPFKMAFSSSIDS